MVTMKLQRTTKKVGSPFSRRVLGSSYVLYGYDGKGKWFERRFPSVQAALNYAAQHGWNTTEIPITL